MRPSITPLNALTDGHLVASLRVRIIEVGQLEPNNTRHGTMIKDAEGNPTNKLQMLVRDEVAAIRLTCWKVTRATADIMVLHACIELTNVKLNPALGKYADFHFLSAHHETQRNGNGCVLRAIADVATIPYDHPVRVRPADSSEKRSPSNSVSMTPSPAKREREQESAMPDGEKCRTCGLSIALKYCPSRGTPHQAPCPLEGCGLDVNVYAYCAATGELHLA